ncbi:hypothetical protein [Litorimonas sp.]|uniref:hypothetical protein n=1 Tax=Litorimonas sp. TaxID=1892381 RepID=UPI003A8B31AD
MTFVEIICALIGTGLSGLGLFSLYRAWKGHPNKQLLSYSGWAMLLLALLFWGAAGGKDRGIALGAIVISLQALLFVAYQAFLDNAPKKARRRKIRKIKPTEKVGALVVTRRIGTALWVTLGCGALSFLTAIGLHELLWQTGVHASNSLVLALFVFPILWAGLSALSLTSRKRAMKLGTYALLGLSSTAILFIGNGAL